MTDMNISVPMLQVIWDLKSEGKTLENIHSLPNITVHTVSMMTEKAVQAVARAQYAFTSYRHIVGC